MKVTENTRKRLFNIISIGNKSDFPSRFFDLFIVVAITLNLAATLLSTFDEMKPYYDVLSWIELITIVIFVIEYALRLWTCKYLYPKKTTGYAVLAFVFSFTGLIDLFTFLPYFLPFFFPGGTVAFRILRVIRIFRLFKVNAQNDAFSVIVDVLYEKRNQLMFSVVLIMIFMIAASLCMYDLEHAAQPDAFQNAFSGIWWSVSTLLTVGYGDIYPITTAGRVMAIIISFLGVGMVAIPTGIISAGFVEHFSKRKTELRYGREFELQFVTSYLQEGGPYAGSTLRDLKLPSQLSIVLVVRGDKQLSPIDDLILQSGDMLVIASSNYRQPDRVNLREVQIDDYNEWIGINVQKLLLQNDESVVMVKRNGELLIPNRTTTVMSGDALVIYDK